MNIFNKIQLKKPKRNNFNLTHDVKMSGKIGYLIPTCIMEAVPGDSFTLGSDVFMRFAPLTAPIMHRIDVTVHYFFVPNRILWSNWEKFITNSEAVAMPQMIINDSLSADQKKFLDYLGVPPCPTGGTAIPINALPMAAYQKVYNDYYRDQNLIEDIAEDIALVDGINTNAELLKLRKRAWEHDYFTSCLPWPQKGADVDIPLGEITLKDDWFDQLGTGEAPNFQLKTGGPYAPGTANIAQTTQISGVPNAIKSASASNVKDNIYAYDPAGSLQTEATTINELRRATRLQEWLEKNARGGTRYIEQIKAHFGVNSKDARLQRPEYITGVKTPVTISEVLNTTGTNENPQGNMSGHALSVGSGYTGKYYVEEHGYIIGILSTMPKTAYQQGIPNTFLKNDPLNFFWPSFAHIGEQEVKNAELYAYTSVQNETFGYIPRYAEYKYMPSRVAGDFRTTLNFWHMGRIFANQPTLSAQFIECSDEDVDRVFAVQDGTDNLYIEVLNKVNASRLMPVYGTPML